MAEQQLLPLGRIFKTSNMAKVLDYFLSNYELNQKISDIQTNTKLTTVKINRCLDILLQEKLIIKHKDTYKLKVKHDRLVGLFSYYRATIIENQAKIEITKNQDT